MRVAVPRLPDAISLSCQLFHGFKTRGYSPLRASRLPDAFEPLSDDQWFFLTKILNWLPQNENINNKYLQSHPELVSGSHCEPILILLRGQMLKRVQHDHQLWSVVFCYIEVQKKLKAHYSLLTTQRPSGRRGTATLILKNHRTRTILSSPHPDHTPQKT